MLIINGLSSVDNEGAFVHVRKSPRTSIMSRRDKTQLFQISHLIISVLNVPIAFLKEVYLIRSQESNKTNVSYSIFCSQHDFRKCVPA